MPKCCDLSFTDSFWLTFMSVTQKEFIFPEDTLQQIPKFPEVPWHFRGTLLCSLTFLRDIWGWVKSAFLGLERWMAQPLKARLTTKKTKLNLWNVLYYRMKTKIWSLASVPANHFYDFIMIIQASLWDEQRLRLSWSLLCSVSKTIKALHLVTTVTSLTKTNLSFPLINPSFMLPTLLAIFCEKHYAQGRLGMVQWEHHVQKSSPISQW